MNCRVVVEAAVPVYDVETPDEAVRIAISKTGEMLNPDLNYVEINMGERSCPHCGEALETAFIAADESLVALELEMTVFNVEREEHASRIARKEIGQRLENIPLEVLEIEELEEEGEEETEEAEADEEQTVEEADGGEPATAGESSVGEESIPVDDAAESVSAEGVAESDESTVATGDDGETPESAATTDEDDEILPEFEELIDE
jgi:uncharacterized protein (UPF0212 family)